MNSRKTETLSEDALRHAVKHITPVDRNVRKCVDGGYRKDQEEGALATPGADLGTSMALMKLGLSPEEAFNLVYNFVTSNNQQYNYHTDQHDGDEGCVIGCGHCNKAIFDPNGYQVTKDDLLVLLNIVNNKRQDSPDTMNRAVLNREHKEKGILIVTSDDKTIRPWDDADSMYFIYDQKRHEAYLRDFVAGLPDEYKTIVTYKDLLLAAKEQTTATLGRVATGLPIFEVDASVTPPTVQFKQYAPSTPY